MNRLTAIGLASLVAYGLLITSKYTGVVSAARDDKGSAVAWNDDGALRSLVVGVNPEPAQKPIALPAPVARVEQMRASPAAVEFRAARDLKAYVDTLSARRANLTGDERYYLARALEECQFTTTVNDDLAAYSAKQRRQFVAGLTTGDPLNARRVAAYDAVDNTQRCLRFQGTKISQRDVDDLYQAAAEQGNPPAQARLLAAELNNKINNSNRGSGEQAANARVNNDDLSRIIALLETHDPEATLTVGAMLAQSGMISQLRIGPNAEGPEPSAFLGAFSLVACDMVSDCVQLSREPLLACAYGGYCSSASFEELYQNFLASPWVYTQAARYRNIIHTAINTRNWALIGLVPPAASTDKTSQ